jgi:hypothetical protein
LKSSQRSPCPWSRRSTRSFGRNLYLGSTGFVVAIPLTENQFSRSPLHRGCKAFHYRPDRASTGRLRSSFGRLMSVLAHIFFPTMANARLFIRSRLRRPRWTITGVSLFFLHAMSSSLTECSKTCDVAHVRGSS